MNTLWFPIITGENQVIWKILVTLVKKQKKKMFLNRPLVHVEVFKFPMF